MTIVHQVPRIIAGVTVLAPQSGRIMVRKNTTVTTLEGVEPEQLRVVLAAIDGRRDVDAIIAKLGDELDADDVGEVLAALTGLVIEFPRPADHSISAVPRVVAVATGKLREALADVLSVASIRCEFVMEGPFASCLDNEFLSRSRSSDLLAPTSSATGGVAAGAISVDSLVESFRDRDLVVCAPEDVPYRACLDVNQAALRAGVPVLFVTVDHGQVVIGPMFVPGRTACFECSQRQLVFGPVASSAMARDTLELLRCHSIDDGGFGDDPELVRRAVANEVLKEVSILRSVGWTRLMTRVDVLRGREPVAKLIDELMPFADCRQCGSTQGSVRVREVIDLNAAVGLSRASPLSYTASSGVVNADDRIRSIGIIGGGTAGYLTALALRHSRPEIAITLIESSEIPIIGVGEATTPDMVGFLHDRLGVDRAMFYRDVQPTWKLGIKFFWGLPGDYYFNYPFDYMHLLEAHVYSGDPNACSLPSVLMSQARGLVLKREDGSYRSLLGEFGFAYHLDNRRFVHFLRDRAAQEGVTQVDAKISDVRARGQDEVEELIAADGRRFSFDLYIDCTGFRSRLLEGALGSRFVDYGSSLYNDTAVVANVPHGGVLLPYTLAETMNCGWCWNIPQVEDNHRGYVFSSRFCTVEQAEEEMRRKNPGMTDPWMVRFRSGRHEHFWKGNVVAIGNSYAFVEPLESTSLHMVQYEIDELIEHMPVSRAHRQFQQLVNKRVAQRWDYLRWFLAVHFKFNRKLDTPYWRHCHQEVEVSGVQLLLDQYADAAPLSGRRDHELFEEITGPNLFGLAGLDCLVLGQRAVASRLLQPEMDRNAWNYWLEHGIQRIARCALPQLEALEVLKAHPELLVPASATTWRAPNSTSNASSTLTSSHS
jgi:tryptophan halogenase